MKLSDDFSLQDALTSLQINTAGPIIDDFGYLNNAINPGNKAIPVKKVTPALVPAGTGDSAIMQKIQEQKSNTGRNVLIAAGAIAGAFIIYRIVRKKKRGKK